MSSYTIHPSTVKGTISVPPSKSQTMRAILFASLADGSSTIRNPLISPDTEKMIKACQAFGAKISFDGNTLYVGGVGGSPKFSSKTLDVGNSGIVLRFVGAIAALDSEPIIFTGDESIQSNRVVQPLLDGIQDLGGEASSLKCNGRAPISVCGPVKAGNLTIDGEDSQPVSALLILASLVPGKTVIQVDDPGEKPWIDMTLDWMDRLGIVYENEEYEKYTIYGGEGFEGFDYRVSSDFSSCAFPLAAAAITQSSLEIENIDIEDCQGDKRIIPILQQMGASIKFNPRERILRIDVESPLVGGCFDINDCVDVLPVLSVLGCFANGSTDIINAKIARKKECDRIACTATQLKTLGAAVEEKEDGLTVHQSSLKGAEVHSHHDHRLAMALAVAGLGAEGATTVTDTACVSKTFPEFIFAMQKINAEIEENE